MGILEALRMASASLRGNKTRTALTLLGMVIGVFAIIVSVTAVKVIDVYFKEKLQFLGSSTFTISRFPGIRTGPMDRAMRNRPPLTYDQVLRFTRSMNTPVAVCPWEDFDLGKVTYGDRETEPNIALLGTNQHFLQNFSYELDLGRSITEEDVQYARPVVVIGADVVKELFPNETPIGKKVRFNGIRHEVIGTLKSKGSFLGFSQDNRVVGPITRMMSIYGQPGRNIATISVRANNQVNLPAAMDEAIGRMRTIRKDEPGEANSFELDTNNTFQSFFDAFTGTLTIAGAIIGLISLVAAGVGIMNIMLVSVTERTREIGVRKSIGAKSRDILRQFLFEAFFLCQIGGVIGILLGAAVGNYVAVYFDITAVFPWGWAFLAVLLVTGIAFVFGGYPALKAARLNPIESLRYE
ncbi:MAG: FtsX-like permease family protein [Rhodothermales bacterium]|nr:FtsX-like permease family protein [Rhodothermales bacterium]